MLEDNDLSPWAHPKAQRWFATLLERSGFVNEVEDAVQLFDNGSELAHGRLLLALLILLGRPGIWPEDKKRVLQRAASIINKLAEQSGNVPNASKKKSKPLSLEQHKRNSAAKTAIKEELEILRRRSGMSNRKSLIKPSTWGKFWS